MKNKQAIWPKCLVDLSPLVHHFPKMWYTHTISGTGRLKFLIFRQYLMGIRKNNLNAR